MDQLIELLKQIQDLAGVAIEALNGAEADTSGGAPEAKGAPPPAEAAPAA